jgi:hypothetical protein
VGEERTSNIRQLVSANDAADGKTAKQLGIEDPANAVQPRQRGDRIRLSTSGNGMADISRCLLFDAFS